VDNLTADDFWDRLGAITQLLHRATMQIWGEPTADYWLHSLGLGVDLVRDQTSTASPENRQLVDLHAESLEGRTLLQLLTAAQELTRPLPVHRPDLINTSQLVVGLCDLIREARRLGC
jgi:hypothetical protein